LSTTDAMSSHPYPRPSLHRYSILNTPYSGSLESSLERILLPVHEKAVRFEAKGTTKGGDEGDITAGSGDAAAPGRFFRAVMRRVPPFPAVGQGGHVFFDRGRGAGDGELLKARARSSMPAEDEFASLAETSGEAVDDDEAVRDLEDPPTGLEAREADVGGGEAVTLPADFASDPRQPKKAAEPPHAVMIADGDDVMEAGAGETIPVARSVV